MSGQQANAWQTARRRQSQSGSRSVNASPQPPTAPQQPRQGGPTSGNNVWAHRMSQNTDRSHANTSDRQQSSAPPGADYTPANGFNSVEVKAFLSRAAQVSVATYKPSEPTLTKAGEGVWSIKTNQMANGQSFFTTFAKQVAGLENGG